MKLYTSCQDILVRLAISGRLSDSIRNFRNDHISKINIIYNFIGNFLKKLNPIEKQMFLSLNDGNFSKTITLIDMVD